jgi:hypothetical protein
MEPIEGRTVNKAHPKMASRLPAAPKATPILLSFVVYASVAMSLLSYPPQNDHLAYFMSVPGKIGLDATLTSTGKFRRLGHNRAEIHAVEFRFRQFDAHVLSPAPDVKGDLSSTA